MSQGFTLEPGAYGTRLVVTGPWRTRFADYMQREQVHELYLNQARGWSGRDLAFLAELPQLIGFEILDFTIKDVSPVHHLSQLRSIGISTYCETPIDFRQLPLLKRCVFYWRSGSDSLFGAQFLEHLFLHRYDGQSSQPFAVLVRLESLSIANSALTEVLSLGELRRLRSLGLYNLRQLRSLAGIDRLTQLEELEVNGCKSVSHLNEISALAHLRRLQFNDDGRVASLTPVVHARELEEVLFYESTNVEDGDLTPLFALPGLRKVAFQNRRHYSHTREQLASALQSRTQASPPTHASHG